MTADTGLVEAAMQGDTAALLRLLELAQPDIRRFARQQCRSSSDAEDAAQEALLLLYSKVGMLRAAAALPGWLLTIVRRACLRLSRTRPGAVAWDAGPGHELAWAALPAPELRLDVTAAVASLPRGYREVILLRDVQEMTIDEIAAQLHLSREAVKGRLHRGRVLMRDYLLG